MRAARMAAKQIALILVSELIALRTTCELGEQDSQMSTVSEAVKA